MLNILKQRTAAVEVKKYAVRYMERCGSFEYTLGVVRGLEERARELVQELGGNEGLESILERMAI